jgi:tight adherence protein B
VAVGGIVAAVVAPIAGPALATARCARAAALPLRARAAAPGVARALADALAAGTPSAARSGVAAGGAGGAAGHELRATARALRLGAPTEPELERLRRRAAAPEWDAIVAGILLQRDAGGDLPALLRDLASALEAAARQDREALAATAQARFTARLVLGMPLAPPRSPSSAAPGSSPACSPTRCRRRSRCLAALLQLVAIVAVRRLSRAVTR